MKIQRGRYALHRAVALAALGLSLALGAFAVPPGVRSIPRNEPKEPPVTNHARGTFEVNMSAQAPEEKVGDPTVGRMALDKRFHGDLEATSKGQMLAVGTGVKGSAGYVAMERVVGTLKGHTGSFALQHSGTMTRGTPSLTITVVPDSGTGELAGIAGSMSIVIADGKHSYDFEYTLGPAK
jgi:hypothetical protein